MVMPVTKINKRGKFVCERGHMQENEQRKQGEQNNSSAWQNTTMLILGKCGLTGHFFQICEYIYNQRRVLL